MVNTYNWTYPEKQPLDSSVRQLVKFESIAQILVNRGIDTEQKAKTFLNPESIEFTSPYEFNDMEKSVKRIRTAVENDEHIVIFGDFDCDGVTSTSLLYKVLSHIGANVSYYIPDRAIESHGLNSAAVCKLISSRKAKLIITVDCGISNIAEVGLAKSLGVDVIITDHHEAPDALPMAYSIINPKSPNALSENLSLEQITNLSYLAGVGVAYKFAEAILESFGTSEFCEEILYLLAIGTIADVVPLLGENRGYVYKGLKSILKVRPKGLLKLIVSAGASLDGDISADTIAFSVAPRVNAAGRLETAQTAVSLFVSDDIQEIEVCVKKLEHFNRQRQQMCDTVFMEAEQKVMSKVDLEKDKAIVIYDENWHPGIIGIVASRLVEKFYRPVFMIKIDKERKEARCSARSIQGLHLYETLQQQEELFNHFGGHSLAAGFSLNLEKINIDKFSKSLIGIVNKTLKGKDLKPSLAVDTNIQLKDLKLEFIQEVEKLAPFGAGNPSPVFSVSDVTLKQYKTMGKANNHLKLYFADSSNNVLEGVWWGKNSLNVDNSEAIKAAFSPKMNSFGGRTSIQLDMKDIAVLNSDGSIDLPQKPLDTVRWIDHRKRTDVEKPLLNYLKTAMNKISIFVENTEIINRFEKESGFNKRFVNRINIEKIDQLMFFELPACENLMKEILEKANPKVIHIMNFQATFKPVDELIKIICGMLKYAHSNKDGTVRVEEISSRLALTDNMVELGINILEKVQSIKINELENGNLKFEFISGFDQSLIKNYEEYDSFVLEYANIEKFRHELLHDEISKIQKRFY